MTAEWRTEVELWLAFERLDHAYLVRNDAAARRELELIARLREEAAEAVIAAGIPSRVDRFLDQMGLAVDRLLQIGMVPALVRSTEPAATRQADAAIGDSERQVLGNDVEVSAVSNGVELGVDLVGLEPEVEDRVRLFVERDGELVQVPLVSAAAGTGILGATMPWSAGLPEELFVVVVQASEE